MRWPRVALFFLKRLFANRGRLLITVSSITLSVVIYFAGLVIINTYVVAQTAENKSFNQNCILVEGALDKNILTKIHYDFANSRVTFYCNGLIYGDAKKRQINFAGQKPKDLSISISVLGVSPNFSDNPVPATTTTRMLRDAHIISGRSISPEDVQEKAHVAVVSETTGQLLFGSHPLGKTISLSTDEDTMETFKVIGISSDTIDEVLSMRKLRLSSISSGASYVAQVYIPYSILWERTSFASEVSGIVIQSSQISSDVNVLSKMFPSESSVQITTRGILNGLTEILYRSLFVTVSVAMLITMIISGLGILNALLFQIRERTSEIGITKAFGASKSSIVFQFLIEGIAISLIGALLAIGVVIVISVFVQVAINTLVATPFAITIPSSAVVSTLLFAILQGMIFSLIPSVHAARIQIADALRFD